MSAIEIRTKTDRRTPWDDLEPITVQVKSARAAELLARSMLRGPVTEVRWNWTGSLQGHYAGRTSAPPPSDLELTRAQIELLARNEHLLVVSLLEDGDALTLDLDRLHHTVFPNGHFPAYVLTTGGKLQDVHYHYRYAHHLTLIPFNDGAVQECEHRLPQGLCNVCIAARKRAQIP